jgi:integrase
MPITDLAIRNAKPGDRAYKISDAGGLHLLINPNGSKLWRLAYRFAGKQKLLAFGRYPDVTLSEARDKREAAKRTLRDGRDPSVQAKLDKIAASAAAAQTFDLVADEYIEKLRREGKAENTLIKVTWLLGLARPSLGQRPVADISAPEVLHVLQGVERRGRHESARRLRSTMGAVFRYAVATTRAITDPTFALRGALTTPTVVHRAALTDAAAFGGLLRTVWGYDGQPETASALRLMALLFPRPGELRMAEWSEFDLVAAQPIWTIPAERAKMRRLHIVPLPKQALAILSRQQELSGGGRLVFPGIRTINRPISENTLNAALRRLGYTKAEATAHGFRATASTLLNESGLWSPDAVERALGHQDRDAVRRAYARGQHWEERVRMMTWWADQCDAWRSAD